MAKDSPEMRDLTAEKRKIQGLLEDLAAGAAPESIFAPDAVAEVSYPYGVLRGPSEIGRFYADLRHALPDQEWRPEFLIAGENYPDDRASFDRFTPLVGTWGHLQATFTAPLLGIPPTHGAVHLRLSQVHHLDDKGRIARSWIMPDLLDLMDQAGVWPLPQMLGAAGMWPGPRGAGGVRLNATDPDGGARSIGRVLDMHHGLITNPTLKLQTLSMDHWSESFMYYAAAGIGMCRGAQGFRDHHQLPFRLAFPDRHSKGHFVRIGDGNLALTGGRLYATHTGEYIGSGPTGRSVHIDVMDFYHFDDDGLICENWLPFDILGLAHQMGVDLLARVAHHAGHPRRDV